MAKSPKRSARSSRPSLHPSPSRLPEAERGRLVASLNQLLADGLDLHGALKVAHWNVKGPGFAALHALFERFAGAQAERTDEIAERAVTLGGLARGGARTVAASSRLPAYDETLTRDLDHVAALAERLEAFAAHLHQAAEHADDLDDSITEDLLVGIATDVEKDAWMLRATLET